MEINKTCRKCGYCLSKESGLVKEATCFYYREECETAIKECKIQIKEN